MKRIFITGGHFTPALAVIDEFQRRGGWEIFYIGRKEAMEGDSALALEYLELYGRLGDHYLVITAGRLQAKFFVRLGQSLKAVLKIPVGFCQAALWLVKYRPSVVMSFGGYVAVPVVFWAYLMGILIVTHEQTVVSGRANRFIRRLARKTLASWPGTPGAVLTGNPMEKEFRDKLGVRSPKLRKIFVTGGNQGSHVINLAIEEIIGELSSQYKIVHQTGDSQEFGDINRLIKLASENYQPVKFLNPAEFAREFAAADLIISRAGANTVTKIAALGKVAILIPIPWAVRDEQRKNAEMLAQFGGVKILPQDKLSGQSLMDLIAEVQAYWTEITGRAERSKKLVILDAAKRIVDEIEKVI